MATTVVTQANRPYDHLYDPNFYNSHGNDHARATTKAMFGPRRIERVPDDTYMFSELPHYPRHTIQVSPKQDIPPHVDMSFTSPEAKALAASTHANLVYGSHRFKFFARPNKQMLSTLPHIVMYAMKAGANRAPAEGTLAAPEPATKTVGTQSVYRESETQTDPYSPDYYIAPNQIPEVLTLTHLAYGAGLPATEMELQIIERTRQKRVFQQMLPPPTDECSLALRMQLMEMQEFREWADREKQIRDLQDKRLELLKTALQERDDKRATKGVDMVDRMRARKEEERDRFLAGCQRERTKVLRKMEKEHRSRESRGTKRDVITEHADFTSQVYAPLARTGHVPDYNTARIEVQPADLTTFPGLLQLEASLPPSLLQPIDRHPKDFGKTPKSSHTIRKELEMANALKSAMDGIKKELQQPTDSDGTKPGEQAATSTGLKKFQVQKFLERTESPRTKEDVLPEEEELESAVLLLQRIIRGRAYQNQMFEGKEKRLDLINELRAAERYSQTATTVEEKKYVDQLREKAFDGVLESIQGGIISETLDQLSKELLRFQQERHIAMMVKLAERDRQLRQAQESGRRQAEERLREREDEMFRSQVMGVHQGTVDSYLEEVLCATVNQAAQTRALTEARLKAAKVNQVVDTLEAAEQDPETVVRELVHSFQLPHVQREVAQRRIAVENKRFAEVAVGALDETYRRVQHNLSS
eukprot:CAMPEP_0206472270 /NCGR_PEP_ID=MMETSP0324_2-20121206/32088_1 /ASSEMBLY_ACC=CAM_ASM_000836 /TAXON_ID=2866 /ORGANISM="Crypthecodinium cohnii, Strain Seligo" /LENGTH=702 /DNA_ID=CAMNT_0053946813 /DNA_START=21 /DNA_END=2129 /DNA_ORIENTATION=-